MIDIGTVQVAGPGDFSRQSDWRGACGDATRATAETGQKAIAYVAERFVELLAEVHAYDLGDRA